MRERWSGQFQRTVPLPFEVAASTAEATVAHVTVRIVPPKAEGTKPHKIASKVGGSQAAIGAGASRRLGCGDQG